MKPTTRQTPVCEWRDEAIRRRLIGASRGDSVERDPGANARRVIGASRGDSVERDPEANARRVIGASRGDGIISFVPVGHTKVLEAKRRRFIRVSRADGIISFVPGRCLQRGFTLIEVLLATVLLAAGLGLAFATLRAATTTVQRGETLAQRSQHTRAVAGFLRRRLTAALPITFTTDETTGESRSFIGEPQRMRFVADLPDYLGRGGPYLHDLAIVKDGDGARLLVTLSMVLAGKVIEEPNARGPEPLVPDLREARFLYRGLDDQDRLGEWQDHWDTEDAMPLQVRIDIQTSDGDTWPPLFIVLPQSASPGSDYGYFE